MSNMESRLGEKSKNYLLFIIDSLNYSHLKESSIELMPFLNELKRKGIYCENMYSQAPYTEAAVMNLYCGQDVLQDNGYLFRFRDAKTTLFEEMRKAGYVTYYNSYQPQCHPSSIRRGIDYLYYNVGYDQDALWSYRLQHYADQYVVGSLTKNDYLILEEIFEDNFKEWIRFTEDVLKKDESTNMIINNAPDYNASEVKKLVESEFNKYKEDSDTYIEEVLSEGKRHRLFKIPAYVQKKKIQDRGVVEQIRKEMKPLFKRIQSMDIKLNLKNCKGLMHGPLRKFALMIKHPSKTTYKEFLKSGYLVVNELRDLDLFQRIDEDCDWFKNAPSARTHIDHYLNWAEKHKGEGKHFACIHIDDIHNPEEFFTYDSQDLDLIRSEIKEAEKVLNQIPKSYYGSLTHDLSLRYMDNVLRYLYRELERKGLLDNTCIAICADHGFSFSGNPLRDSFVINLYLENYNIPCVFTGTGLEPKEINGLRTSKDIPATICKLASGSVPKDFSGHSLTEEYKYEQVQIEYCGGGCPDLSRREIKLAAFDNSYFVGSLCKLDETLSSDNITEIYDLTNDPKQLHNLCKGKYDKEKAGRLVKHIRNRREDILRSRK